MGACLSSNFITGSDLRYLPSPEQHWSLMPLHAVCSTIRPASFLYGSGGGYGGQNPMSFPVYVPSLILRTTFLMGVQ